MTSIKLLLNTSLSGPVSFFLLANARDYLREEGLSVAFSGGGGAAVVVPQVRHGSYDAGYGDISALIERIARGKPNEGPVAVYTTFNTVPFTIAVPANSSLRKPKDFEERTIVGHAMDAALITFDMLAAAAGIDASASVEAVFALTFRQDHSVGADQRGGRDITTSFDIRTPPRSTHGGAQRR